MFNGSICYALYINAHTVFLLFTAEIVYMIMLTNTKRVFNPRPTNLFLLHILPRGHYDPPLEIRY